MTDTTTAAPTSPLLGRPGAVAGEGADAGVAAHYGDPGREQRLLEEGLAVVDLSHRGVVRVTGPDRLTWLHSMTSQHLTGLAPRQSAESLVLSPKGHVEHALHLVDDGESAWITVEPGTAPALVAWLDSMRFMLRVEVTDLTDAYAVLGEPLSAASAEGEPLAWVDPWPALVGDTAAYGPETGHPGESRRWRELVVPRADLEARRRGPAARGHLGRRGAARRGLAAPARLRDRPPHDRARGRLAAHGRPPAQGLLPRPGDHRAGAQPRPPAAAHRLPPPRRVRAPAARPRARRSPSTGARSGRLTTVARHHVDGPIALAVVKRNTPVDADLVAEGVAGAQTVIVTP